MAEAYGSVAHPVNLGPFSRIVGVHWGSKKPPLAFAFRLRLGAGFVADDHENVAPIYYSPFGQPNGVFGIYHPDVFVPKDWGAWVLDDKHEWHAAQSFTIDGLPDFGAAPWYVIGSPVPSLVGPIALNLEWSVAGDPLDFTAPVIGAGDTEPRHFNAGAAVARGKPGAESSLSFSTGVSVVAGLYHFAYAGAVPLSFIISGSNVLIDNKELIVLCLPVTA